MKKTLRNLSKSKLLLVLVLIAIFSLYWVRVVNLDQDLPAWGVVNYQPKDEGCYSLLAVYEWEYGTIAPENPLDSSGSTMYTQEHIRTNLLGNILGIAGFHIFGDNYYGLRMPMVVLGFFNLAVMLAVLLLLRRQYGKHTMAELWGIAGLILLVSLHFYFYVSSRTVEPSTLRMFFVQLLVLIWLCLRNHPKLCFFLMGACITTSVFLVYITNIFLYLAVGLLLLMIWKIEGFRAFIRNTLFFALGSLLLLFVAEAYYRHFWDCSTLGNFFGAIGLFTGIDGYELSTDSGLSGLIVGAIKGTFQYFSSFVLLYAPALLALSVALLPVFFYQVVSQKDKTMFFMLAVPACFLLQTMVSQDYIWRKFLVVAPCFIYLVFWGFLQNAEIFELYQRWVAFCDRFSGKWRSKSLKCLPFIYLVLSLLFTLFMVYYHLVRCTDLGKLDMTTIDKLVILLFGCIPLIVWAFLLVRKTYRNHKISILMSVCLLGGATLALNLCMLGYHVWIHPTFAERDMMVSLSDEYDLDNEYVIGDCVMGITLYNDLKPVIVDYTDYANLMVDNPGLKLFMYSTDSAGMREYLDTTIFSTLSDYTAKQICVIPGTLQIQGSIRDFALYEAALRKDVQKELQEDVNDRMLYVQEQYRILEENSEGLSLEEISERKEKLQQLLAEYSSAYGDQYGDIHGDITTPFYVDIYGDIYGDIYAPIYGRIFGDVYGSIYAPVEGDIYGDVYGSFDDETDGQVHGTVYG